MELRKVKIMESVYKKNDILAAEFNKKLNERKIYCINTIGSPGAGKTSLLIKIIERLNKPAFVIEGDIESEIDTVKLKELSIGTYQINTGGACHLDAPAVAGAFNEACPDFSGGFLFIENIGNLVCPAEFFIGEHIKMLVCSVTDGGDKPYKYPLAFEKADIILLNKIDLIDFIDFDRDFFLDGIKKLNPSSKIIETSGKTGSGTSEAAEWIIKKAMSVTG